MELLLQAVVNAGVAVVLSVVASSLLLSLFLQSFYSGRKFPAKNTGEGYMLIANIMQSF